ncbi:MAG: hypothetical protein WCK89_11890 [bacterium]
MFPGSGEALAIHQNTLGMNFRNPQGRREMLWPQDLDEIARDGQTANGCRIAMPAESKT